MLLVCRVPSKPVTLSQKSRTTPNSCGSSDETSDSDEDSDEANMSDDDNDVSAEMELLPPTLDKNVPPPDDSGRQVIEQHH